MIYAKTWCLAGLFYLSALSGASAVELFPRPVEGESAVPLVEETGDPVGAIGLVTRMGYEGFLLVTTQSAASPTEEAHIYLDRRKAIPFRCVAIVQGETQLLTCVTQSPVFWRHLRSAKSARLKVGPPEEGGGEVSLSVLFEEESLKALIATRTRQ